MNAVSRFDTSRLKRWRGLPRGLDRGVPAAAYALGGALVIALVFQLFFRYQYVENGGVLWRIDRLTEQTCQVSIGEARCSSVAPSASVTSSTSSSTSTSISVSPSLKARPPKAKPP